MNAFTFNLLLCFALVVFQIFLVRIQAQILHIREKVEIWNRAYVLYAQSNMGIAGHGMRVHERAL